MNSRALPLCRLVATGGTIAMQPDPATNAPVPALNGDDLLCLVPGLSSVARLQVTDLFNIPSDHIGVSQWKKLLTEVDGALRQEGVCGVVVSHGTDTLEETAWFLDLTVSHTKPVVLTGAQRSAAEPDGDGPRNLRDAVRVCVSPAARDKGVMVVFDGRIDAARTVSKTHTLALDTFRSGDNGVLGVVDHEAVVFTAAPMRRLHLPLVSGSLPRVDIVAMHAGADGELLRAAVRSGARGIVVQALGCGNVNPPMHCAIVEAVRAGVVVAVASRCARGGVRPVYGFPGGGQTLKEAGAILAGDLSPHKARILLMLALQVPKTPAEIQSLFND
jgi:L-asparaginase